jgi:hypothetical protein
MDEKTSDYVSTLLVGSSTLAAERDQLKRQVVTLRHANACLRASLEQARRELEARPVRIEYRPPIPSAWQRFWQRWQRMLEHP